MNRVFIDRKSENNQNTNNEIAQILQLPNFLPVGFLELLEKARQFFETLSKSESIKNFPEFNDIKQFEQLLFNFWTCVGRDASLGLSQSTPDHVEFRKQLGNIFYQSEHIKYCYEKNRGYAGDFKMMEDIWNMKAYSASNIGIWLENWMFNYFPPYISVRSRVDILAKLIEEQCNKGAKSILNIACGAAPELRLLNPTTKLNRIDLVDQDHGAWLAAKNEILNIPNLSHLIQLTHFNINSVYEILEKKHSFVDKSYEMIYSMGLFDYLNERTGAKLINQLWSQLSTGGVIAIGNYNGHHWSRYVMEAVMDWFLVYRDPKQLLDLSSKIDNLDEREIIIDDTGLLQILVLHKK